MRFLHNIRVFVVQYTNLIRILKYFNSNLKSFVIYVKADQVPSSIHDGDMKDGH